MIQWTIRQFRWSIEVMATLIHIVMRFGDVLVSEGHLTMTARREP